MQGKRYRDPGEMSFLLAWCSDDTGSGSFGWAPEILAHLKTSPERTVRHWTHPHVRTHSLQRKNIKGFQNETVHNSNESSRNSPWISSSVMRSLAEKYFRSFAKLRKDLPLSAAGCCGERQGELAQTPGKRREHTPYPAPALPASAPRLSNSDFGSEGTLYQENVIGLIRLPAERGGQ